MPTPLRDKKQRSPRNAFILFIVLGAVCIYWLAIYSESTMLVRAAVPLGLMLAYIVYTKPREKYNNDSYNIAYANSCYYLGFIYTLIALAVSILLLKEGNIAAISGNFGISLTTTILGFSFRAWWIHFGIEKNAHEVEEDDYLDNNLSFYLADLTEELRALNNNHSRYSETIDDLSKSTAAQLTHLQDEADKKRDLSENIQQLNLLLQASLEKEEDFGAGDRERIIQKQKEQYEVVLSMLDDAFGMLKNTLQEITEGANHVKQDAIRALTQLSSSFEEQLDNGELKKNFDRYFHYVEEIGQIQRTESQEKFNAVIKAMESYQAAVVEQQNRIQSDHAANLDTLGTIYTNAAKKLVTALDENSKRLEATPLIESYEALVDNTAIFAENIKNRSTDIEKSMISFDASLTELTKNINTTVNTDIADVLSDTKRHVNQLANMASEVTQNLKENGNQIKEHNSTLIENIKLQISAFTTTLQNIQILNEQFNVKDLGDSLKNIKENITELESIAYKVVERNQSKSILGKLIRQLGFTKWRP